MTVLTKSFAPPPTDTREILRYAGAREGAADVEELMRECLERVGEGLAFKVCYCETEVSVLHGTVDLGFARVRSSSMSKKLDGCSRAVVFAATVGLEMDRLIARHQTYAPSKALMLQAIGAERIEALCDTFERQMATEYERRGLVVRPRFSAGYGDIPLELQRDIFRVLDCQRRIGLTLNHSLLMSPSKSVTAIIGIANSRR